MSRANVGFIGLGDQGAPMAEALIGAHSLYLWARRPETVRPFAGTEAHIMDTAQDVARKVEVLCLCLPGDEQLISLLFDQRLASELPHGATVINHATGDPKQAETVAHRLADYDLNYLDAPVSGGRPGAIAGTLTCFIGGDATTLAACEPVLSCYSNAVRLMGSPGAGQMTKLLNTRSPFQTCATSSKCSVSHARRGSISPLCRWHWQPAAAAASSFRQSANTLPPRMPSTSRNSTARTFVSLPRPCAVRSWIPTPSSIGLLPELMGWQSWWNYSRLVQWRVQRNAHRDQQGTPSVNSIFTPVRLAHRVPARRTAKAQAKWSISRLCLAVIFIER